MSRVVRVGINGYGTIGKRVADAVIKQGDMELVGVVKVSPDYSALTALKKGIKLYTLSDRVSTFRDKGIEVAGTLEDLLSEVDVIIDATPAGYGAKYLNMYREYDVKAVFQGGEKADVAEVSFNSLCNYEEAQGKNTVRVVSCNTTGLLRLICSLNNAFGVRSVRAVIVRRGADPKEVKKGPINAIILDKAGIPSHHGLDVKTVLPWLDILTVAVSVPTTLMHVHVVNLRLGREVCIEDVVKVLKETPRIVLANSKRTSIRSTAELVELSRDLGRLRYDIPELVIWEDYIHVDGDEIILIQAVHQESIVIPENIDAIRALTGLASKWDSIRMTDESLGLLRGELIG